MSPIRTYLDSNILIYAFKGQDPTEKKAFNILLDPDREFVSSELVRLETLPTAIYRGSNREEAFFNRFFNSVARLGGADDLARTFDLAFQLSQTTETGPLDAWHIATAIFLGAEEFITAELPTKPMFRIRQPEFKILSIRP